MKHCLTLALLCLALAACSNHYPNTNPVGMDFPRVSGTGLDSTPHQLPAAFRGEQTLLLLGYKQDSQFDIDRWLIGLDMSKTELPTYEIPAIQGLFPRMISDTIDNGMRKGIPSELWSNVITVYEDGEQIQEFTGNERPNNARVVLLDAEGRVSFFYDRGFSVAALNSLREAIGQQDEEIARAE